MIEAFFWNPHDALRQRRFYDAGSRLLSRTLDRGTWHVNQGGGGEEMRGIEGEEPEHYESGESAPKELPALEEVEGELYFDGINRVGELLPEPTPGQENNAVGGGESTVTLSFTQRRQLLYPQLGWNDAAQWHHDIGFSSRKLDWTFYSAGGLDSLVGATKWKPALVPADRVDVDGDYFFVRDHLGSVVLTLEVLEECVQMQGGVCVQNSHKLRPFESYEYTPYGTPSIHVPVYTGYYVGPGVLATKSIGAFTGIGAKGTDNLLDPNDIGRPTSAPTYGRTWTRRGSAVPVAQSTIGWNYLFTGRAWDADVRQYYYRHRWYDPHQGRWNALDPIGYAGGLEQYQYCGGNPVNLIDPMGLSCGDDFLHGVGASLNATMDRNEWAWQKLDSVDGWLFKNLPVNGFGHALYGSWNSFVHAPLTAGRRTQRNFRSGNATPFQYGVGAFADTIDALAFIGELKGAMGVAKGLRAFPQFGPSGSGSIPIIFTDLFGTQHPLGKVGGLYDRLKRTILVEESLSEGMRAKVAVHEGFHAARDTCPDALGGARRSLNAYGYNRSGSVRLSEEFFAELSATGSLSDSLRLAFGPSYARGPGWYDPILLNAIVMQGWIRLAGDKHGQP